MNKGQVKFLFFGTSKFSIYVLESMMKEGVLPEAVVTFPDKPEGRKLVMTQNSVKSWAIENNIEVIEVNSFKDITVIEKLKEHNADLFVVASFGKILPAEIIYMPPHKTLNVHPSLLPKLRGPSPIQNAILGEDETGVTIMRLDENMDEGPIIAQKKVAFDVWPMGYAKAEEILGGEGGELLAQVIPKWVNGELREIPQGNNATYTSKIQKSDSDVTSDPPNIAIRKILAFECWPRARSGDLIITSAHIENDLLIIDKVIPPGKKEMTYDSYLRGRKVA